MNIVGEYVMDDLLVLMGKRGKLRSGWLKKEVGHLKVEDAKK
jgi:hypothetical protein